MGSGSAPPWLRLTCGNGSGVCISSSSRRSRRRAAALVVVVVVVVVAVLAQMLF